MFKWKGNYFDIYVMLRNIARIHRPNKEPRSFASWSNSAWHNYMLKNQWNPTHHHLEDFSPIDTF